MGSNYTVTIPNQGEGNSKAILTFKDLHAIQFAFDSPFDIVLANGELLAVEQVIRIIPKRRLVAFGHFQGKSVVVKLFFNPKHAKRHIKKELEGIQALNNNKIPTPSLYFQGMSEDKRVKVLIFERIFEAQNLEDIWREKQSTDEIIEILQAVIIEIATQHVLGVLQHDMHLKNFLCTEKIIYTLDGAQIECFPSILAKKISFENLALFLAQFGVGVEKLQEKLFKYYAKARGILLKPEDVQEMFLLIKKINAKRWERFEKKIFRNCTDFARTKGMRTYGMYHRHYLSPNFAQLIKNPDTVFNHPKVKVLKAGRSSTVIRFTMDGRVFVVKRYNLKSIWHRLRRVFRATRATTSWRLAQKLNLFGVQTAKPIAFIEKRFMGLRGKSYYITEYVSGEHAGQYFTKHEQQEVKVTRMIDRVTQLLKNIAKCEVTHGDLKATNILINTREEPIMIDLDGAKEHVSLSGLRKAWQKEIKRFLKNFRDQPALRSRFKNELT